MMMFMHDNRVLWRGSRIRDVVVHDQRLRRRRGLNIVHLRAQLRVVHRRLIGISLIVSHGCCSVAAADQEQNLKHQIVGLDLFSRK